MKKRKQQAARQDREPEELGPQPQGSQNPFKSDFLQDLFGDMKEFVNEAQEDVSEKFDVNEINEVVEAPETAHIPVEQDHVVFEDLSNPDSEPLHKKYQFWKEPKQNRYSFIPQFNNMNDLKRAIVMKEIFDTPRGLRRNIR
ncbi:MAG: hypothetical protein ISR82_03505 [Candidatus Marinimicrobia bacterium]|nr:hypothetical protein [Candidatus Neomarinimicrobiota bacterium]MBL7010270.1 hypothetical protein [Candidatus Neomarinimicrobiota bacterium]MBL7030208.1 hypothetical protein [Candidatus Neomarinimicrobiota bacterium]